MLDTCPICDATLATGPHGSREGVRISIDKKLSSLESYRKSEKELEASKREVGLAIDTLKNGLEAVNLALDETSYACTEVGDYLQTLNRWRIGEDLPISQDVVGALSQVFNSISHTIAQIEGQQGNTPTGMLSQP